MANFRAYPTVATTPNRKQRKSQRKVVFAENKDAYTVARKARREAKRKINDQ